MTSLEIMDTLVDGYTRLIRKLEADDPRTDQTLRLRKRRESIDMSATEIKNDPGNFVVQEHKDIFRQGDEDIDQAHRGGQVHQTVL